MRGMTIELDDAAQTSLDECWKLLSSKRWINDSRTRMFDGKYKARHLGISVPPQLEKVETTLMWPAKAVEALESLINLEGYVIPDGTAADFGLDAIWRENRLGIEATQAHVSALKYGVAFLAVLAGDLKRGEPSVVIRNLSPTSSTAIWDPVLRRVTAALTVISSARVNGVFQPIDFILFLDDRVITATLVDNEWQIDERPHDLGRCPIAVLPFKPSIEEPFGRSRITRGVMTIAERVARTLLRMEISAEFYSMPQRYILGADEGSFTGPNGEQRTGFEVTIGRLLALGLNEDDDKPTVGQFPQMSMQPHVDMIRSDAALFAGETNIPVSSLGIIHDNPASDAAMQSAYMALYSEAERSWEPFGAGWVEAMQMAVTIRDGSMPDELLGLRAKWARVDTPTMAARGDFIAKQITAFPWMAESDVVLEESGYDQTTVDRLRADRRRAGAGDRLQQLIDVAKTATGAPNEEAPAVVAGDDPAALRQKFEALGVAIRAGVSPESAAAALGLPSLKFTGAVPVSLRVPESDARELEEA